jgi:hypothetical protein
MIIEPKIDLIDRTIKLAELAIQAQEKCPEIYRQLCIAITKIQNPAIIWDPENDAKDRT